MTFKLDENVADISTALRDLEPQAPKHIKAVMIQAATKLEDYHRLCADAAVELDHAASLRIGMMDSQSRADEVSRTVRTTMADLARRMREATQP